VASDLMMLVFTRDYPEPSDSSRKYTTTWFDLFRIENGKIAEHWDPDVKR
jgi:predicted SnoaL-like aldol condensation-catalyzing enzyme